DEHGRRRDAEREAVGRGRRDREQRAEAQELHERGIARPETVVERSPDLVHLDVDRALRPSRACFERSSVARFARGLTCGREELVAMALEVYQRVSDGS